MSDWYQDTGVITKKPGELKKRLVYRFENNDNEGPYLAGDLETYREESRSSIDPYDMPGPIREKSLSEWRANHHLRSRDVREKWVFAFPSIYMLRKWFPSIPGRVAMREHGGQRIKVYEVHRDYLKAPSQVVFFKPSAKFLYELNPRTLKRDDELGKTAHEVWKEACEREKEESRRVLYADAEELNQYISQRMTA